MPRSGPLDDNQARQAFLRAIFAAPDDDAPRLAFADWLSAGGDPRGELIRLQCAMTALPGDDPRRYEAVRRQEKLVKQFKNRWLKPLAPGVAAYGLDRGFIEHIYVRTSALIAHAGQVFERAPIREIDLSCDGTPLAAVAALPQLAMLRRLRISGSARDLDVLLASPSLRGLRSLTIEGGPVGCARAVAAAPHLGQLEDLGFVSTHLDADDAEALAGARALGALRALFLRGCGVGDRGAAALVRSAALPALSEIYLSSTEDSGYRVITNGISERGVAAMATSPGLRRVRELWLNGNAVGTRGAEALAASPHCGGLVSLRLDDNGIGDAGARALGRAASLERLEFLGLRGNPISVTGALALIESTNALPRLRTLAIDGCWADELKARNAARATPLVLV